MIRSLLLIGLTFFCFSGSFTFAQTKVVVKTVLLDIGRSNADGGWYAGATPASPDANGNYWNTLDIGKYAGSMLDKTGTATSIGAGFININNPIFTTWNGPAGDGTAPWSINASALGDLGNKDAAIDYVHGTNIRMSIGGLVAGKQYRFNFFSSRRYEGDPSTTISVYGDNTFDSGAKLSEGTVANRSASQGWVYNADTLLTLDNLTPTGTSLYINIVGSAGGAGALNALSIQELDTTPPTITLQGSDPLILTVGSSLNDPGALVTDNLDANRTISGTGIVDNTTPGTYTLTYQTTDTSGNTAAPVTRSVIVKYAVLKTVLLDIGRSNADGGWYGGATPASPDANGNYWNTLDSGKYAGSMTDKAGASTTIGAGFIAINNPIFTTWNGPAGDGTVAWSINASALGDLGNKDAAIDYVWGTNIRMSVNGLTVGKKYQLNFFCSRRWEGDPSTTISVYGDNTFDSAAKLSEGTVANRSASQGWVYNADTLLTIDNLTPTGTSLYINIVGSAGGAGALNALSIQELDIPAAADITPPVITVSGNTTETVFWGSSYVDAGATAVDNGLPVNVISNTSGVNTSVLGSYQVTYSATDAASNIASASRTVNVVLPVNADVAGPDGLSPLLRYALGASSPDSAVTKPSVTTDADDLILTALIRTSGITVVGQASTDLSATNGGFSDLISNPNGVLASNQSNLLPGTERREFRTPKNANRKFIRLKVSVP